MIRNPESSIGNDQGPYILNPYNSPYSTPYTPPLKGTLSREPILVIKAPSIGPQKSTQAKIRIGISHINPLIKKPNKAGISL